MNDRILNENPQKIDNQEFDRMYNIMISPNNSDSAADVRNRQNLGKAVFFGASLAAIAAAVIIAIPAWAVEISPFESEPISPVVAPIEEAVTLASVKIDGQVVVLLVTDFDANSVEGLPVSELGIDGVIDPIDAAAELLERSDLTAQLAAHLDTVSYPMTEVLSAAGPSERNIGIGTNFPEHQEESTTDQVFIFPKFGMPNPPRTTVSVDVKTELLDYEVELCARFDRALETVEDFDAATKGFFLCADFTNRANLMRYVDLQDPYSGIGFSDGKSGPGYFPTGPFLVVPRDWKTFIAEERITTYIDDEQRQDARAGEMIVDHRGLVEMALADEGGATFQLAREPVTLMDGRIVQKGVNLMSGTAEGVVFRPPTEDVIAEAIALAKKEGRDPQDRLAQMLVERDLTSREFLQPGQTVYYRAEHLGEIQIRVVAP